jgi:hypothetical protein
MKNCKLDRAVHKPSALVMQPCVAAGRFHDWRAVALGAALIVTSGASVAPARAAQLTPNAASTSVIAEHALAQQGFSIALASVVLQTHLYYALVGSHEIDYTRNTCQALDPKQPASGGWEVSIVDPSVSTGNRVSFYYDSNCTRLYTTLDPSLTDPNGIIGTFYTVDGKPNGTLTTTGGFNENTLQASGLGTFIGPIGSTAKATLGLACVAADDDALNCSGGVVQDFASLNQALGSVTPLTLDISDTSLTFKTRQSAAFSSGNTGSLTLAYSDPTQTDLLISGGSYYGSDSVKGEAGSFSLFPATPTDWTEVDVTHDIQFDIHVVDNSTRQLKATISAISSGKSLATATLDQSGTGTITFSDQSQAKVLSWVIADSPTTNDGPVNLNQQGLTGSWYNPLTGGQGIVTEVFPDLIAKGQGLLAGGWFTFDVAPQGGADKQRWYSLQGAVTSSNPVATVGIYTVTGGNFNAGPAISQTKAGSATLSFSDCTHGTLGYTFTDGSGRSGNIPLTRLDTSVNCSSAGDTGANAGKGLLSGAWYDPNTSGQGLLFDISPSQNILFAGWYTFAPNGQQVGGGASQRWYTLQSLLTPNGSATGLYLTNVPIYTAAGGVFNNPVVPTSAKVGTATVSFSNCNTLAISYNFTGGSNAGQSGTMNLVRTGPTPAGCNF